MGGCKWAVVGDVNEFALHVMPVTEDGEILEGHEESPSCPCQPSIEVSAFKVKIFIHHLPY